MDLLKLKEDFTQARNLDTLNNKLKFFLNQQGISTFTFSYYFSQPSNRNQVKYDFMSDNIRAWHEYYLSQHFEEVDSDLKKARQSVLPIFWELKNQLQAAKTQREKQLRHDSLSLKVKIEKGLSIPIHGPDDDFAILLLQQRHGEHGLDDYQKKEAAWLAVSYLYYNFLRTLLIHHQPKEHSNQLSLREMECLRLAAAGLTANDIAMHVGITPRTVNFHMQNINKKLGTRNKSQAIHLMQSKGLL